MSGSGKFNTVRRENRLQKKQPERRVLDALLATHPTLYVNVASRPVVEIPFDSPPEEREAWPIDSDRVQAEIALFAFRRPTPLVLRDREVTQIARVLKGFAWKTRQSPRSLGEAFDEAPLIEVLYTLLTDESPNEPFKGSISELQRKLNDIARRLGVNQAEKAWPNGPAQFSKRLAELSRHGTLGKFGIRLLRNESARPRSIELHYDLNADAAALAASEQRRDQNSAEPQDFRQTDAGDGAEPSVFDDLTAPPTAFMEKQ